MSRNLVLLFSWILSLSSTEFISDQCKVYETRITCTCLENEKLQLPDNYNYEHVTSLFISACGSATLHSTSLMQAKRLQNIVIHNISDILIFEPLLTTKNLESLELIHIRRIPSLTHNIFKNIRHINLIQIQDTLIENFGEQFTDIVVTNFIMKSVIIQSMNGLNFSGRGKTLEIKNTDFRCITNHLNFAYFSKVEIFRSTFKLQVPGLLLLEGCTVFVENSIFTNVTMNLVASEKIRMNATCGDGKSSLRLFASRIESSGNKLPTEIIYTKSKRNNDSELFLVKNNTVCIAGNCKCLMTNGHKSIHELKNFFFFTIIIISIVTYDTYLSII